MDRIAIALIALLAGVAESAAAGTTFHVDQGSGAPFPTGTSWPSAFQSLQDALDIAQPGDVIKVAAGVYKPDVGVNHDAGDVTETFEFKPDVRLVGGYAGSRGPDPDERDVQQFETTLSGDLQGDDWQVDITAPAATLLDDNANHLIGRKQPAPLPYVLIDLDTEFDGFTIRGGGKLQGLSGGGAMVESASPKFTDCTFTRNFGSYGGALHIDAQSQPLFLRCSFIENYGAAGGGEGSSSIPYESGGAATVIHDARPRFVLCDFVRNSSWSGGAVASADKAAPVFAGCRFIDNLAFKFGGAVFEGTTSVTQPFTGGSTFISCSFVANRARFNGGAVEVTTNAGLRAITNCTFAGNEAGPVAGYGQGGGIHVSATIKQSTPIVNSIFWGNRDLDGFVESSQIHLATGGGVTPSWTTIQGWTGTGGLAGTPQSHLMALLPDFVVLPSSGGDGWGVGGNDNYGFVHLVSPDPFLIDGGSNGLAAKDLADVDEDGATTTELCLIDADGTDRFQEDPDTTDHGVGAPPELPVVDLGAFEFCATCEPVCQPSIGLGSPGGPVLSLCGGNLSLYEAARLVIGNAPGGSPQAALVSTQLSPAPLAGGQVIHPQALQFLLGSTPPTGEIELDLPGLAEPADFYLQWAVKGPAGLVLSNALHVHVGP